MNDMTRAHAYTIMPLNERYIDEICSDIKEQYEKGIATLALFSMTLVPEGMPPKNKVEEFCRVYDLFRDRLAEMHLECGILVQETIGHGYPLNEPSPFQKYVGRTDGEEKTKCCPYDENLRQHFHDVMKTIASHRPKAIMVDDDFRLLFFYGRGCTCPMHMKRLEELCGRAVTREELNERIEKNGEGDPIVARYLETQKEALIGAAKAMRQGIDSVDATIPVSYCTTGSACEFAPEIAKELAGKGNPSVVRSFVGIYSPKGAKEFTSPMYCIAQQMALMKDKVDYIIAEGDTCPHNRYALSARHMHSFRVGAILEGTSGSKQWITKLDNFEPKTGKAYRKILSEYNGFYKTLSETVSKMTPVGCCIPVLEKPYYGLDCDEWDKRYDGWARCVLERLGLPLYFSDKPQNAVFLEGDVDKHYSDEQLKSLLSGTVLMASDTAERINARGFSAYTGVDVAEHKGSTIKGEEIVKTGNVCPKQKNTKKLTLLDESAEISSWTYHSCGGRNKEKLFPGTVTYKNSAGGTVTTFAGTPVADYYYTEGFSFLNATRKNQLIDLLESTDHLPVYYPGDMEIYLRAGTLPDGALVAVWFNLSFDPMEEVEMVLKKDAKEIVRLMPDGTYKACTFRKEGDTTIVDVCVEPMLPAVLVIK